MLFHDWKSSLKLDFFALCSREMIQRANRWWVDTRRVSRPQRSHIPDIDWFPLDNPRNNSRCTEAQLSPEREEGWKMKSTLSFSYQIQFSVACGLSDMHTHDSKLIENISCISRQSMESSRLCAQGPQTLIDSQISEDVEPQGSTMSTMSTMSGPLS